MSGAGVKFMAVPALVTIGDQTWGDTPVSPAKAFIFDDQTIEVYEQRGQHSSITLVFGANLNQPYQGPFDALPVTLDTDQGQIELSKGPGCGCGYLIKSWIARRGYANVSPVPQVAPSATTWAARWASAQAQSQEPAPAP